MTLNFVHRSFKVTHFGGNLKPVPGFIKAVNSSFRSVVNSFGDIDGFIHPRPQPTV